MIEDNVEDGAAAYMLLAEKLAARPELLGEAFNFSNEIQITVLDLVRKSRNNRVSLFGLVTRSIGWRAFRPRFGRSSVLRCIKRR